MPTSAYGTAFHYLFPRPPFPPLSINMAVLIENTPFLTGAPQSPLVFDTLPRPVRAALERGGTTARTVAVAVSCDARQGRPHGGYYCYLAVHPLDGRKKDTFMGIAEDPLADL